MKTVQRTFLPGSPWVYLKLYSGNKTADDILIQVISSAVKELQKKGYIEKWFFIRYADPDFHLRIRLLTTDIQHIGEIINRFYKKLELWSKENLLWKMQLDTYNRELERYGNTLIEEAESFFWIDSETILSIIKKLSIYGNENYRWMICLKMIDCLLSDFSLNIIEKQQLMETLSHSYKTEFGFNEYNSKQFNTKFRENKSIIESVFNNTINDKNFVLLNNLLHNRSKRLIPVVESIKKKLKKKNVDLTLNDLLASYVHLMLNRLFRSKNRLHELIIYDFMRRYYTSEAAKLKYNQ